MGLIPMLWAKLYWSMMVPHTLTRLLSGQCKFAAISDMTAGRAASVTAFQYEEKQPFCQRRQFYHETAQLRV